MERRTHRASIEGLRLIPFPVLSVVFRFYRWILPSGSMKELIFHLFTEVVLNDN
jgi:hypothetical protein